MSSDVRQIDARRLANEEDKERTWSVFASSPHDSRRATERRRPTGTTSHSMGITSEADTRHTSAFKCSMVMITARARVERIIPHRRCAADLGNLSGSPCTSVESTFVICAPVYVLLTATLRSHALNED